VYFTQPLFFRLLPKLDVVGSSPIARSLEGLTTQNLTKTAAGIGGRFFAGEWVPEQVQMGPAMVPVGPDLSMTRESPVRGRPCAGAT